MLEQLAEVVQILSNERGDAEIERNGHRFLARHLRERLVCKQEQRVLVELVRRPFDLAGDGLCGFPLDPNENPDPALGVRASPPARGFDDRCRSTLLRGAP